jgi:hypothetical protein
MRQRAGVARRIRGAYPDMPPTFLKTAGRLFHVPGRET